MRFFSILICCLSLIACHNKTPGNDTLTIGTISGPETELVETAQKVALEQYGLHIKIIEFNDYNLPNEALQDGSLDANVYQHLPYLQATSKAHGYHFTVIGKTFVFPMGIYSNKYKSISKLPNQAIIAIPNDPSNETRALILLQTAGLIALNKSYDVTPANITNNPKHLLIKEIDAAQLPRVLPDVDAAVINTTFALPANLKPSRDAIFTEGKHSPYANLIVAQENSPKQEQLMLFVKAMHSSEVTQKAHELFGNDAIAAW